MAKQQRRGPAPDAPARNGPRPPGVLLIPGHSPTHPGARNEGPTMAPGDDTYEYYVNEPLVARLLGELHRRGIEAAQDRYLPSGGNVARWDGASDLLVEFHCNAFDRQASGTEVLYAEGSAKGAACARIFQTLLVGALGLPDRGIRPKRKGHRGGYLLWGVRQTALIPEPFFIDNNADLARARSVDLVGVYATAIEMCLAQAIEAPASKQGGQTP